MAKFKLSNLKFEQIMKDYAEIRETTIPAAVHMNARLLCVELARRTQPFGNEEKVGNDRVRKDISNTIKPQVYFLKFLAKTTNQRLKATLRTNFLAQNWENIKTVLAKVNLDASGFEVVQRQNMAGVHKANRNSRTGRTYNTPNKFYIASDSASLHNYIATRQKLVGLAKSGWAECAKQLRKGSQSFRGIPKWVTRHKHGFGIVVDNADNAFRPTVTLTNTLPWADQVIRPSEQLIAQSVVAEKMKKQMAMILKKRVIKLQEAA